MRNETIRQILDKKVIAIVRGILGEDCVNLARALHAGGVDILEATFDPEDPALRRQTAETIRRLNNALGHCMCFGAGTVTSPEMAEQAAEAGARFIVAPNTDPAVIKRGVDLDMAAIPGALTPTEIKFAHDCGADFVKVFPACNMGVSYFKNIRAPLKGINLLAVGGVTEKDARDYLAAGCQGIGVAGCLFKKEWVANREWERIEKAAGALLDTFRLTGG